MVASYSANGLFCSSLCEILDLFGSLCLSSSGQKRVELFRIRLGSTTFVKFLVGWDQLRRGGGEEEKVERNIETDGQVEIRRCPWVHSSEKDNAHAVSAGGKRGDGWRYGKKKRKKRSRGKTAVFFLSSWANRWGM